MALKGEKVGPPPRKENMQLHLGPMSLAETRKLIFRLEGLRSLNADELKRAYEEIGGHPRRALEYLDALLRGGKARFINIEEQLVKAIKKAGINAPGKWTAQYKGNLDKTLAETITLAADDVLLKQLLANRASSPCQKTSCRCRGTGQPRWHG